MINSIQDLLVSVDRHSHASGKTDPLRLSLETLHQIELQCVIAACKSGYIKAVRRIESDTPFLELSLTPEGLIELLFVPRNAA